MKSKHNNQFREGFKRVVPTPQHNPDDPLDRSYQESGRVIVTGAAARPIIHSSHRLQISVNSEKRKWRP